jgi:hypothetical protein
MLQLFVVLQVVHLQLNISFSRVALLCTGVWWCQNFWMKFIPGHWLGLDNSISWPPHSPDIIPVDFFF